MSPRLPATLLIFTLILFTAPPAGAAKVKIGDDPTLGSPSAPLVMIEFSSFQCGYCALASREVLPRLKKEYVEPGKLEIVYLDFPLQIHGRAKRAAIAAGCAHDQGRFWEYHDLLFDNQDRLGSELYPVLAEKLDLDLGAFETCLEDKKKRAAVEQDTREAGFAKVGSTPTFVFGRRIKGGDKVEVLNVIRGAPSYEDFQQKVETLLAAE